MTSANKALSAAIPGAPSTPAILRLTEHLVRRAKLMREHKLLDKLDTVEDLRTFMSWQAYAAWDFMLLLKRLQQTYTGMQTLWTPPRNPRATRLVNEIVLSEESAPTPDGQHLSHYELHLAAMEEVGASSCRMRCFTDYIAEGVSVDDALQKVRAPQAVRSVVLATLNTAAKGTIEQVLGSFFHGRNDAAVLHRLNQSLDKWSLREHAAPMFFHYLGRHVDPHAASRERAAQAVLAEELKTETQWVRMLNAAILSVDRRIDLWDSLLQRLDADRAKREPAPVAQPAAAPPAVLMFPLLSFPVLSEEVLNVA